MGAVTKYLIIMKYNKYIPLNVVWYSPAHDEGEYKNSILVKICFIGTDAINLTTIHGNVAARISFIARRVKKTPTSKFVRLHLLTELCPFTMIAGRSCSEYGGGGWRYDDCPSGT